MDIKLHANGNKTTFVGLTEYIILLPIGALSIISFFVSFDQFTQTDSVALTSFGTSTRHVLIP